MAAVIAAGKRKRMASFATYIIVETPSGSPAIRLVLNDDQKLVRQLEAVGSKIMKVFSGFALAGARVFGVGRSSFAFLRWL